MDAATSWKINGTDPEVRDRYLEPFLRLCFPTVHAGIDWSRGFTPLDQELHEVEFRRQVAEYEARKHMPYITSIERLGREEGRQEGFVAARQKAVLDALEIRFGQVPDGIRERIEAIQDEPRLRVLLKSAIQAGSIEEFIRTL
jgi:hypothetical protein